MVGTRQGNPSGIRGQRRGETGDASGWGAVSRRPSSWFTRLAAERLRLARLGRAFEELRIDVRGKRIVGTSDAPSARGADSFDVLVSALEDASGTSGADLSTTLASARERLQPGGVLCVFVRTRSADTEGLGRDDIVWSVAGSIAHAGFEVVFAEGSRQLDGGLQLEALAPGPVSALRLLASAVRGALAVFTSRRFRERIACFLDRMDVCPRQALVVARRSFAQGLPLAPALARRAAA